MFQRPCHLFAPAALAALGFQRRGSKPSPVRCVGEEFLRGLNLAGVLEVQPTSADALAHYGRLKAAHAESAVMFGSGAGEKIAAVWGKHEHALAKQHVPTAALNPSCFLLTTAHAGLACLDGAKLLGNRSSPAPPSTIMIGIGSDSTGKSRQTSYAIKLLSLLRESMLPPSARDLSLDAANVETERPSNADRGRPKLPTDALYGQAFSGKGFASRCMQPGRRSTIFLIDEALSLFTQVGLASDPGKVTDNQLEDQPMLATVWSTGMSRKDLADGGGYNLPWTTPSFHTNAHVRNGLDGWLAISLIFAFGTYYHLHISPFDLQFGGKRSWRVWFRELRGWERGHLGGWACKAMSATLVFSSYSICKPPPFSW